ncbi:MAG: fibronectin type III domain-containing protein [Holophagales bacterium]|nr:fibronectin type III domain-containing protein [Holophagales bacterium]
MSFFPASFRTCPPGARLSLSLCSSRRRLARGCAPLLSACLCLFPAVSASATEVSFFRTAALEEVREGERDGVSLDARGRLELSPRLERVFGLDEPFVYSAAATVGGSWLLGTGNGGKVFEVTADGGGEMLGALPEPEVFAVAGRADGTVVAGGSPGGKVYRLENGVAEELFASDATYVWALAEDSRGRLLVGTGLPGKVWRLGGEGEAELLWSSPDAHVRTLLPRADGSVLVGTAGQGLVVELRAGEARTLYDGAEPEVLAFAAGEDRTYAALLASEASFVDLSAAEGSSEEGEGEVAVDLTVGSRSGGHSGPRSVLLALDADGRTEILASLDNETVHALRMYRGELWVGTGQDGHLYRWVDEALVQEAELDELQLVGLVTGRGAGAGSMAVVTTNAASVYVVPGDRRQQGTYTSQVLDAGDLARFGRLHWRGRVPEGSTLAFAARSGMASEPDATWTPWLELAPTRGGGRQDLELELGRLGPGRYVQWQARFDRGRDPEGPVLVHTELSYRQRNRQPEIRLFEALPPGKILVEQSFNPTTTTFEPWSPNRDGIFTTLRKERDSGQQKQLYKRGYRTLRWEVADPNGDELRYRLEVMRGEPAGDSERSAEDGEGPWLMVVDDLEETYYSFDATVLPDGLYHFRLTARDQLGNGPGEGLEARRIGEPVIIDHTPPRLTGRRIEDGVWRLEVVDDWNPIRNAVVSVDAGEWRPVHAADDLLDGRREQLELEVEEGARLVLLRITDGAHNVVTLDLTTR